MITAVVLAAYGVLAAAGPARRPGAHGPDRVAGDACAAPLALPITWQAAALYAVGFGGYVAFSVYLPTYLKNAYALTPADAANRMAGFVWSPS